METTRTMPSADAAIPRQFYCAITHSLMLQPVTAPDGMSYEQSAWRDYERSCIGILRSPITRRPLPRNRAVPNEHLRTLIREHPATAVELQEREREESTWAPGPDRNAQIMRAASVGGGACVSLFLGTLTGVVSGWVIGETFATFDPGRLLSAAPRNHQLSIHFAQRGAQVGLVYGMSIANNLLRGNETNHEALKRSARQLTGVHVGAFAGGAAGLALGSLSWPLACFTFEMCDGLSFDSARSLNVGRTTAIVGCVLGIVWGFYVAAQEWSRTSRRRVLVRRP